MRWRKNGNDIRAWASFILLVLVTSQSLCAEEKDIPEEKVDSLSLEEVLQSGRQFFPKIAIEKQKQLKAEASHLASEGAFDLRLSGNGQIQPKGFYRNEELSALVEQDTKIWGTKLYGGWRFSNGNFPSYEGKRVTGSSGELEVGVEVPVLRGGYTDPARTSIERAKARAEAAEASVGITINHSLLGASEKYWKWASAAQKLQIAKEILDASMDRQEWLEKRVRLGDLPKFEALDNQRSILDRKNKVVEAERKFRNASLELSFYYRDDKGIPVLVAVDRAPKDFPEPKLISENELEKRVETAAKLRPELRQLGARSKAIEASESLASNQLWPSLNIYGEASQDLGTADPTREQGEIRAGIRISIPLERRKARGDLAAARADRFRLDHERRMLLERVRIDIGTAIAGLEATYRQIELAKKEVELNEKLVKGERTRFKNGDSHIMFVNLRELNLGDSRLGLVRAQANYQIALAGLLAVTGELAQTERVTK